MGMLDGLVTIVTGGAQGIGAAYAKTYVAEGAKVVVTDVLDPEPLVAELKSAGGDAIGVVSDVTDEAQNAALVAQVTETYGRIDVLMNNAALFGGLKRQRFETIDLDEFDAVLRVNIRGVWQMTKAVTPVMRKQGYGKIINIASGTVFKGTPLQLDYVTSKGGVIAMTRVLARELGEDNICVNAIAPGLTESEAVTEGGQFSAEHFAANIGSRAIKRPEVPEDLVGAAVFLASSDSDFITGQVLCIDGGSVTH
ncbi:MAG: SDR family oxidoreductase [Rhodospirillaceae bacterium]|jgi:NAD(P)-dependent dehydrogenase (short-subunit alcohol dehydrogenase family)|nr:SDR family oxidoreductase [Rhodospirillaceae bacterium]MBT5456509.1 SDR family oxidoreductase [Rhodospirillaceae bacterium]MBT7248117.1 SDR family oxidoreductase [Rhodospirillaceae bacterium]